MGSTGSIGTQTLDIIREYPERFRASVLTANRNWELLSRQAMEFHPDAVVIADTRYFENLKDALEGSGIRVLAGADALDEVAALPEIDMVVGALVGFSGLSSTLTALRHRKQVALANKETLVVAGEIIDRELQSSGMRILPIDSEHSAIFQCLVGEKTDEARKIILTASGGPFRDASMEEMENATVERALNHPNWDMGAKVTIDSATMMNKGFEMIEARWLFGCPANKIEIVVHPQSIVHSMVEFCDGSVKAQLGAPDMHIPISYALAYPDRIEAQCNRHMGVGDYFSLTFHKPDFRKFPMLGLAYQAIEMGGNSPAVLNAANEVAVKAFLSGKIKFTDIFRLVNETMQKVDFIKDISIPVIFETNKEAYATAESLVDNFTKL